MPEYYRLQEVKRVEGRSDAGIYVRTLGIFHDPQVAEQLRNIFFAKCVNLDRYAAVTYEVEEVLSRAEAESMRAELEGNP